jgi:hypothetical protein
LTLFGKHAPPASEHQDRVPSFCLSSTRAGFRGNSLLCSESWTPWCFRLRSHGYRAPSHEAWCGPPSPTKALRYRCRGSLDSRSFVAPSRISWGLLLDTFIISLSRSRSSTRWRLFEWSVEAGCTLARTRCPMGAFLLKSASPCLPASFDFFSPSHDANLGSTPPSSHGSPETHLPGAPNRQSKPNGAGALALLICLF